MDNVEDMDVLRLTPVNIYIYIYLFILFVACISCLFIWSMLKNHFFNGIVEIKAVCPMTMEEDPITVVLDNDERSAALCLELVSS